MKVRNIVFSGAMASILMMGAATAAATINNEDMEQIGTSIKGVGYQTTLQSNWSELDGYTVDKSTYSTTSNYSNSINLTAGTDPSKANYTYTLADGSTSNAETAMVDETKTVSVSEYSAQHASGGIELNTANSGWDSTVPAVGDYSYTTAGGTTYTLGKNGDNFILEGVTTPTAEQETTLTLLKNAYLADSTNVSNEITTLGNHKAANQAALSAAETAFTTDQGVVAALGNYKNANKTYEASLGSAVDAHILDEEGIVSALFNEKETWVGKQLGYDTKTTDAKTELADAGFDATDFLGAVKENKDAIAQVRSDAEDAWEKGEAWISQELGYDTKTTDAKTELTKAGFEATTLIGALQELDQTDLALSGQIADEAAVRASEDAKLQSAIDANRNDIAMLDSKMNDLDENLSAGIASSVALSSVAVANVQKGEMSVGGGYGNYNSKSAMAFGAALGITDNWSANAGVGFGFGKDTKASFRVGTNYKFKLF